MVPAFQAGEVVCHDVTTTSVRVTWPKLADKKYPVYAYRVCTAEVGSGFEVPMLLSRNRRKQIEEIVLEIEILKGTGYDLLQLFTCMQYIFGGATFRGYLSYGCVDKG